MKDDWRDNWFVKHLYYIRVGNVSNLACFPVSLCQKWCGELGLLNIYYGWTMAFWIGHKMYLSYYALGTLPWFRIPWGLMLPSPWHNTKGVNNLTCPHERVTYLLWVTGQSSPSKGTLRTFLIFDGDWTGGIYLESNLTFIHNSKLNTDFMKDFLP